MNYPNPHGFQCPWYSLAEQTGAPNIKWCEETLCQWVSEPANTWSNLGYLVVGLFIILHAYKTNQSGACRQFGFIISIMGCLSLIYHLSNFYLTQILDFMGMFLFLSWAIGCNLIRLKKLRLETLNVFMLVFVTSVTAIVHVMYKLEIHFQILILIGALVIVFTEFLARNRQKLRYHWFFLSLLFLAGAFAFSAMDVSRFWCDPTQHFLFSQGHAIWHWLSAVAMFGVYRHYLQIKIANN